MDVHNEIIYIYIYIYIYNILCLSMSSYHFASPPLSVCSSLLFLRSLFSACFLLFLLTFFLLIPVIFLLLLICPFFLRIVVVLLPYRVARQSIAMLRMMRFQLTSKSKEVRKELT